MELKTNEDRMVKIVKIAEEHYGKGEVIFVGVKFDNESGLWIAKMKLASHNNMYESADTSTKALKHLKRRVFKIIERYNNI